MAVYIFEKVVLQQLKVPKPLKLSIVFAENTPMYRELYQRPKDLIIK